MMTVNARLLVMILLVIFLGAAFSCLEKVPEEIAAPPPDIPVPFDLSAVTDDGSVTLSWNYDQGFGFSKFIIYRSDDDGTTWNEAGNTPTPPFQSFSLRNGTLYWYKVSGVNNDGIEGNTSIPFPVKANIFSLLINNGAEYTNSRNVTVHFTAPAQTQSVIVSEDPLFAGASWVDYEMDRNFILSSGDGSKIIYAQFKDELGYLTNEAVDSIKLDTHAAIADASFAPSSPLAPGSAILFSITPEGLERGGNVSVSVDGLGGTILALDDGTNGDQQAADGVYDRAYTFPQSFRGTDIKVRAVFVDAAGNQSEAVEFADKLQFTDPPRAVYLYPTVDSTATTVTIRWSEADADNFERYDVYRDRSAGISEEHSFKVASFNDPSNVILTDTGLSEDSKYYYQVYVVNDLNEAVGSQVRGINTDNPPPDPVVCDELSSIGIDRLTLTWNTNMNSDFRGYRVYRSTSPGVTDTSAVQVGPEITDRYHTYLDDGGLDLTNNDYYYRVYVYDKSGQKTRSNEVSTE